MTGALTPASWVIGTTEREHLDPERKQADQEKRAKGMRATIPLFVDTAAMTEFLPERLDVWLAFDPRVDADGGTDALEIDQDTDDDRCRLALI
ncbi:hypothetical protein PPNSA23_47070 [Phyllobacterium phragmitis]|uniref:Uncharacterized protein n=1 Tax=Phyllobacterium phragmitis TaxID=2670329 RepID=A0ABQ0H755_9HYPH